MFPKTYPHIAKKKLSDQEISILEEATQCRFRWVQSKINTDLRTVLRAHLDKIENTIVAYPWEVKVNRPNWADILIQTSNEYPISLKDLAKLLTWYRPNFTWWEDFTYWVPVSIVPRPIYYPSNRLYKLWSLLSLLHEIMHLKNWKKKEKMTIIQKEKTTREDTLETLPTLPVNFTYGFWTMTEVIHYMNWCIWTYLLTPEVDSEEAKHQITQDDFLEPKRYGIPTTM
jgi:hypothetical protein